MKSKQTEHEKEIIKVREDLSVAINQKLTNVRERVTEIFKRNRGYNELAEVRYCLLYTSACCMCIHTSDRDIHIPCTECKHLRSFKRMCHHEGKFIYFFTSIQTFVYHYNVLTKNFKTTRKYKSFLAFLFLTWIYQYKMD